MLMSLLLFITENGVSAVVAVDLAVVAVERFNVASLPAAVLHAAVMAALMAVAAAVIMIATTVLILIIN